MITISPQHSFSFDGTQNAVYHANIGEGLAKHEHSYNHFTICHNGSCVIRLENKERIITKKDGAFDLPANQWHEIEALEDNTVFVNIFAEGTY
jgi:quercetin dioxygenase-like cupin family protein